MLRIHPVVAALPEAPAEQYRELVDDMRERGQEAPITLYEGRIWDGRARYRAAESLGLTPWIVPLRRLSPIQFYIQTNYERAGAPDSAERKALVNVLGATRQNEHVSRVATEWREWLRSARAEFERNERGQRQPCAVCGKHAEFVHAHHSFPLRFQLECGVEEPIHDHDWLCPVHHKRVHMYLSGYLLGTGSMDFLDNVPDEHQDEWFSIERIAGRGIDLCCEALGRDGLSKTHRRYDPPFALYIAEYQRQLFTWPRQK